MKYRLGICDSLDFGVMFIVLIVYSGRRREAVAAAEVVTERGMFKLWKWLFLCR